ncbi:glycosyltransferase family 2 protein [Flindersiella endophytica]
MAARVAVVIPARDEADRVAATVRAAAELGPVDLVVVVDDGSSDATADIALEAGAVVVSHPRSRGKAAALETGARTVTESDPVEPRPLLFLDADLGETAANAGPLIEPVLAGEADMTIATLPVQAGAGGHGFVVRLARDGIERACGQRMAQPLSGQRCLTRKAFEAGLPLATGFGIETGLTIDLVRKGFRVAEVPADFRHRATGNDVRGYLHRGKQWLHVAAALRRRGAFPT